MDSNALLTEVSNNANTLSLTYLQSILYYFHNAAIPVIEDKQ